jgi:hypothetical protein
LTFCSAWEDHDHDDDDDDDDDDVGASFYSHLVAADI